MTHVSGGGRLLWRISNSVPSKTEVTVWDEDAVRHIQQLKEAAQKEVNKVERTKGKEKDPPNVTTEPWTLTLFRRPGCEMCRN